MAGLKLRLIAAFFAMAGFTTIVAFASKYFYLLKGVHFVSPELIFILILVFVLFAAGFLAWVMRKLFQTVMPGWVDYLGGAISGFIAGLYFLGGLLAFIFGSSVMFSFATWGEETMRNSILVPWVRILPFLNHLEFTPPIF